MKISLSVRSFILSKNVLLLHSFATLDQCTKELNIKVSAVEKDHRRNGPMTNKDTIKTKLTQLKTFKYGWYQLMDDTVKTAIDLTLIPIHHPTKIKFLPH